MNHTVKKILGYLAIAAVVILTLTFIKRLPAFVKLVAFGANIFTIYFAYTELIKRKDEK